LGSFCILDRFLKRAQFEDVPLKIHFKEANEIVAAVWSLVTLEGASLKERDVPAFLKLIRDRLVDRDSPRTRSALAPINNLDDLRHVVERNGTALATVTARSPAWLEEHGKPLDITWTLLVVYFLLISIVLEIRRLPGPHLRKGEHDHSSG
jgi:hypothetical protein